MFINTMVEVKPEKLDLVGLGDGTGASSSSEEILSLSEILEGDASSFT